MRLREEMFGDDGRVKRLAELLEENNRLVRSFEQETVSKWIEDMKSAIQTVDEKAWVVQNRWDEKKGSIRQKKQWVLPSEFTTALTNTMDHLKQCKRMVVELEGLAGKWSTQVDSANEFVKEVSELEISRSAQDRLGAARKQKRWGIVSLFVLGLVGIFVAYIGGGWLARLGTALGWVKGGLDATELGGALGVGALVFFGLRVSWRLVKQAVEQEDLYAASAVWLRVARGLNLEVDINRLDKIFGLDSRGVDRGPT